MMNKNSEGTVTFKNHPYMIFNKFVFWGIAVFFFFTNLIKEFLTGDKNVQELLNEVSEVPIQGTYAWIVYLVVVGLFIATILYGFFIWKNTMIICDEKSLIFKKRGLLSNVEKQVSYRNISNITVKQSIVNRIFRVETLYMDINSSKTADEDDYFIILSREEAHEFRTILTAGKNDIKDTLKDNNGFSNYVDNVEHPLHRRTFKKSEKVRHIIISETGKALFGTATMIVIISNLHRWGNGITAAVFFGILIPIIVSLFKNINKYKGFSVARFEKYISIEYGLVDIREFSIPVKKIMAIEVEQNLIGRIFGCSKLTFEVVGTGNKDDETKELSLYMKDIYTFAQNIIPEYSIPDYKFKLQEKKVAVTNGIISGILIIFLLGMLEYLGINEFLGSKSWVFPIIIYCAAVILWIVGILNNIYGHGLLMKSQDVIYIRNGILDKHITSAYLKNVESIYIYRNFFMNLIGMEKLCMKTRDSKGFSSVETGYYRRDTFSEVVKRFREGHRKS